MARRFYNKTEMYLLVDKYLSRTSTLKDFCEENSISKSTFGYWLCKYNREQKVKPGKFLRVSPAPFQTTDVTVILPNGIRISGAGNVLTSTVADIYRNTL